VLAEHCNIAFVSICYLTTGTISRGPEKALARKYLIELLGGYLRNRSHCLYEIIYTHLRLGRRMRHWSSVRRVINQVFNVALRHQAKRLNTCGKFVVEGDRDLRRKSAAGVKEKREREYLTLAQEVKMPSPIPPARIVLTTLTTPEEAAELGRTLVEERLAACATVIPAIQSIYRWKGEVESSTETLLLIKTGPDQLAALELRLHELHSYETPEFLVLDVSAASQPYLDWLQSSLRQP
jgi:periplasmic divalent cation tolerance protein